MKKVTCFFRLILPIIVFQLGFNASVSACQHANAKTHKKLLKTTIADVREDHYDLKYTKLTIALNNNNTNIDLKKNEIKNESLKPTNLNYTNNILYENLKNLVIDIKTENNIEFIDFKNINEKITEENQVSFCLKVG